MITCTWRSCGTSIQRTPTGTLRDGLLSHLLIVHQISKPIALQHVANRLGPAS